MGYNSKKASSQRGLHGASRIEAGESSILGHKFFFTTAKKMISLLHE